MTPVYYLHTCWDGPLERAKFGDSSHPMFNEVDDKSKWVNYLGIGCREVSWFNVNGHYPVRAPVGGVGWLATNCRVK